MNSRENMNVNCVNIEKEEEFANVILIRFIKTQEIFPSVTRVLSIFLTATATRASVERVNFKERVPKVSCSIPAASYVQRWALCSNTEVPVIQKLTSPSICTNQWTGFYRTRTSVMKELMLYYLHVFIEVYSLIMTKQMTSLNPKSQRMMLLIIH